RAGDDRLALPCRGPGEEIPPLLDIVPQIRIVPQRLAAAHHRDAARSIEAIGEPLQSTAPVNIACGAFDGKAEVSGKVIDKQRDTYAECQGADRGDHVGRLESHAG